MTLPLPTVTKDFIVENKKLCQTMSKSRRGGPYPKHEKDARRDEVYRLHFEYGYSARKISDLMKINRNTINGDIDYWYSRIVKSANIVFPEGKIILTLEELKVQRTRLREQIDKATTVAEKISIERLLLDVNSKICYTYQKTAESICRIRGIATDWANKSLEKDKKPERLVSYFDTISISEKAREKIQRIIKEDRIRKNY